MSFAALADQLNAACVATFGVDATLDGAPVRVVFDRRPLVAFEPSGVASGQPMASLLTSQVPASPVGRLLVLPSGNWRVAEHEADGLGMSRLMLEVAA